MIAKSGVDGEALFFELNNGCICCTVKDDLVVSIVHHLILLFCYQMRRSH